MKKNNFKCNSVKCTVFSKTNLINSNFRSTVQTPNSNQPKNLEIVKYEKGYLTSPEIQEEL